MGFSLRNENYLNIQGWMVSELGLKGNELLIYAVIYGFSQDGTTAFGGSLSYLMQWTGASKPTVINCLKSLIDKGLVFKHEYLHNGVRMCEYTALRDCEEDAENGGSDGNNDELKSTETGGKETLPVVKNFNRGGKETLPGVVKKFNRGGKETLPNNKDNNKDNNKANIKDIYTPSANEPDGMCDTPQNDNMTNKSSPSRKQLEAEFESVWAEYPSPRKQGKELAKRAFMAARKSGTAFETIRDGLSAYKRQIEAEHIEARYIKQGGTWFHGKGWQDDYNTEPIENRGKQSNNRALNYKQKHYSAEELRAAGIDFGDSVYEDDMP